MDAEEPADVVAASAGATVAAPLVLVDEAPAGVVAASAGADVTAAVDDMSLPAHDGQGTVVVVARAVGGELVGYVRVTGE